MHYLIKRKLPLNIKKNDIILFEHELEYSFNRNVNLIFSNNIYLYNLELYKFKNISIFLDHTKMNPLSFFKKIKNTIRNIKKVSKTNFSKENIHTGAWVLDEKSFHYFHFLADTVPRIINLSYYGENIKVLVPSNLIKIDFIKFYLDFFNFDYRVYESNTLKKVNKLVISPHLSDSGNYHEITINKFRELISNKLNFNNIENNIIYLSRNFSKHRKISNENQLVSLLEKYNVKIVYPEKLGKLELLNLLSKSNKMIGLHGGGLTNMLFLKPNSSVFEIRRFNDKLNNCYFSLSNILNFNYFYHLAESVGSDLYISDVKIDIIKFEEDLIEFINI